MRSPGERGLLGVDIHYTTVVTEPDRDMGKTVKERSMKNTLPPHRSSLSLVGHSQSHVNL